MESYKVPFYKHELSRDALQNNHEQDYSEIIDLLQSKAIIELIENNKLTLGMIKPTVGPDANKLGYADSEASDEIETRIAGLGILAKFSFVFDPEGADSFYEEPAKSMISVPPLTSATFPNRWEEYKALMLSGPATVLLLHGDDAIQQWRSHLGHWNIVENHDPNTIRGSLGVNNHNNLVHGSDSMESVAREISIITKQLQRHDSSKNN